ncbi:MAG: response regulator [Treponema sp.]|nr:response regulator [Treponema sp.]
MKDREKIILVDDSLVNLKIGSKILIKNYDVFTAPSAEKLFQVLEKVKADLILLDINMPVMDGYEAISILKANEQTKDIPVIFLTSNSGSDCESECLALGAADYMLKPYSSQLLLKRVETQLRLRAQEKIIRKYEGRLRKTEGEKAKALEELQWNIFKTVTELLERREEVTGGHINRANKYVEVLLDVLRKNNIYQDIVQSQGNQFLLQSTLLYDMGKVLPNDQILLKAAKLTDEEYA